jgi:hypothetical protein
LPWISRRVVPSGKRTAICPFQTFQGSGEPGEIAATAETTERTLADQSRQPPLGDTPIVMEPLKAEEQERWRALSPEQRAFVIAREPQWRRAHEIAASNPGVDAGDV